MTKKDYQLIADAVRNTVIELSQRTNNGDMNEAEFNAQCDALDLFIVIFSAAAEADNPRFDPVKFGRACSVLQVA